MFVGVLKLEFHIPHARSLKDKRAVVRRFRDRVRARFDVSIAEVGHGDLLQSATFGVACVSSDATICDSVLAKVAQAAALQEDAVLVSRSSELVPFGDELYEGASPLVDDEDDR
jgi:uncharacterized protein YlxP (DUF503 family)